MSYAEKMGSEFNIPIKLLKQKQRLTRLQKNDITKPSHNYPNHIYSSQAYPYAPSPAPAGFLFF